MSVLQPDIDFQTALFWGLMHERWARARPVRQFPDPVLAPLTMTRGTVRAAVVHKSLAMDRDGGAAVVPTLGLGCTILGFEVSAECRRQGLGSDGLESLLRGLDRLGLDFCYVAPELMPSHACGPQGQALADWLGRFGFGQLPDSGSRIFVRRRP